MMCQQVKETKPIPSLASLNTCLISSYLSICLHLANKYKNLPIGIVESEKTAQMKRTLTLFFMDGYRSSNMLNRIKYYP